MRADVLRLASLVAWLPAESRCAQQDAAERATAPDAVPDEPVQSSDADIDEMIPVGPPGRR